MRHGCVLGRADFIGIQEHRLGGEKLEIVAAECMRAGWDIVLDAAYTKETQWGGGTAALASDTLGIRAWKGGDQCSHLRADLLQGRFTSGIIDLLGGTFLGVFYGISGKPLAEQVPLWHAVATCVRAAGLPFILMGDWQATPSEMAGTGLRELLGADIIAPSEATNTTSGRVIDYFLVSRNWSSLVSHVWVETATNFATHLPVSIRIQGARSLGLGRRMTQPKVHGVEKPETVKPVGLRVDWEQWLQTEQGGGHTDYADIDDDDFDSLVSQWYSGAELELNGVFGHVGQDSEADYMGIGQMSRVVACALGNRRRGASDDAGLIGHRLSWTARGIHLVNRWAFKVDD